ncbi:substrate-binding domain-containing protein [Rhodopila globiformis]|uniref:Methanol oxidase n=1 Tax=Rhodopila globiformis TaxID=1071 RepID=A0A2S6NND3_RHOGL|nr:substrate-binding domain-containing protein [Rhodopila globiformis]PPQ38638.1 methanol oxidase [Rhodopila globiformis]
MTIAALTPRRLALAACLLGLVAMRAEAQAPGLGGSVELVDPKVFRVCADPRSLPFSNEAHQGFEDKLAEMFAQKLGKTVSYTYYPRTVGFVRNTLNALKCDVIMGDAQGDDMVLTTTPYYHAYYALVVPEDSGLTGVTSLEDPRLKGKHIGVVAGTPPATIMARDGLIADARPFQLNVDTRVDAPTKAMIDEIANGTIDAGVLWGPIGGYYASRSAKPLRVIPLTHEQGAPMDFRIAMGVRRSDRDWKRTLNHLIADNQGAINKILIAYGVPIVDEQGKAITQ